MNITKTTELQTNRIDHHIFYKEEDSKPLPLGVTALALWPLCFITSLFVLFTSSCRWAGASYKHYKLKNILTIEKCLEKYAAGRAAQCDLHIEKYTKVALYIISRLKHPEQLNLPLPSNEGLLNKVSNLFNKFSWKSFPQAAFIESDFFERLAPARNREELPHLTQLEEKRIQLRSILQQKAMLEHADPATQKTMAKVIAQQSLIKTAFEKQNAKRLFITGIAWLLPFGLAIDQRFNAPNDRQVFENKKQFFPEGSGLNHYSDLVAAHNDLVEQHPYLVPYCKLNLA